jgi:HAD superfamily hydrolase (TIGR01490 family)
MSNNLAIFDIDNTLVRGSTLFELGLELRKSGLLDFKNAYLMFYNQVKYRITSIEANTSDVKDRTLDVIKGLPIINLEAMIGNVIERVIDRGLYKKSLELIEFHKRKNDTIWLATAGPKYIASKLAERLGLDDALGTEIEVKEGLCTGKVIGSVVHGEEKAKAIIDLIEKNNYLEKKIYSYSDSIKDLPMLNQSSIPNAVNPDRRLRSYAENMNWNIYDTKSFKDSKGLIVLSNLLTFIKK